MFQCPLWIFSYSSGLLPLGISLGICSQVLKLNLYSSCVKRTFGGTKIFKGNAKISAFVEKCISCILIQGKKKN